MGLSALAAVPEPAPNGLFFCAKAVLVMANCHSIGTAARLQPIVDSMRLDASRTARRRFVRGTVPWRKGCCFTQEGARSRRALLAGSAALFGEVLDLHQVVDIVAGEHFCHVRNRLFAALGVHSEILPLFRGQRPQQS